MGIFVNTDKVDIAILMMLAVAADAFLVTIMMGIVNQTAKMIPDVSAVDFDAVADFDWYSVGSE